MSIFGDIRSAIANRVANLLFPGEQIDQATKARLEHLAELQAYYDGQQKPSLRVKSGQFDDNLTVNLVSLIVDKAVSSLVGDPADGKGVKFVFPSDGASKKSATDQTTGKLIEEKYVKPEPVAWVEAQWEANHKDIFLHKLALSGAETGFPAVKIVPDGDNNIRLLIMNPLLLKVDTLLNDIDTVIKYTIRYTVMDGSKQVGYRETTTPTIAIDEKTTAAMVKASTWTTLMEKRDKGDWQTVSETLFDYPFAPILAWQNLPVNDTPYGKSDIEDVIVLQDRVNAAMAWISKNIRLYSHPQRYSVNLSTQPDSDGKVDFGPDQMPAYFSSDGTGKIEQLVVSGDVAGSLSFLDHLIDIAFEVAREVDWKREGVSSGRMTNFTMKVLCKDMLDKLGTKRMLYGEALRELNRRMLIIGGKPEETCELDWPDPMPEDEVMGSTAIKTDLENGLVSKQTASGQRGYDWEKEIARMEVEQASSQNVGARLIKNFFAGNMSGADVMQGAQPGTAQPITGQKLLAPKMPMMQTK